MEKYILSIDCGTQSLRAIIFDKRGSILAHSTVVFEPPYFSLEAGYAEQHPEFYRDKMIEAVRNLSNSDYFHSIQGVCLTTQRDTLVCVDEAIRPTRPAILWLDARETPMELSDHFSLSTIAKYKVVGMDTASLAVMQVCKPYYLKKYEPEVWEKTAYCLQLSTYLNYILTGEVVDSAANQVGHLPFDVRANDFYKNPKHERYIQFGIPKEKLYPLKRAGEVLGYITKEFASSSGLQCGIPVIAGATDKGCETLGNGCLTDDSVSISFGTTATAQLTTKKYAEALTFIPPYPSPLPGHYNPEFQIYRGYWLISWFKSEMAHHEVIEAKKQGISPEELLNKRLSQIPVGSEGLMLQPYWTPGIKMQNARGAIIGFSDIHTRLHIYRAIIEGINFGLMDGIAALMRSASTKILRAGISGGGSQNDEICQITADMLNMNITRSQTFETSSLGAAMIGFVGLGEYEDLLKAANGMVHIQKEFKPNERNAQIYDRLYKEGYKKLFPSLTGIYKKIREIIKG